MTYFRNSTLPHAVLWPIKCCIFAAYFRPLESHEVLPVRAHRVVADKNEDEKTAVATEPEAPVCPTFFCLLG